MINDNDKTQEILQIISEFLQKMGVEAKVDVEEGIKGNIFNILSSDSNLLIGQRGANLLALQHILNNIVLKRFPGTERFVVDVDDYKRKREWYLRETAKKAMEQVKKTHRAVVLEPMPAYERKVIHAFLSEDFNFETESVGDEPNRRIVIKPKTGI